MATTSIKCPACKGTGHVIAPRSAKRSKRAEKAAKALHGAGYSLREIAKMLGYKSPRSASILIARPDL